MLSGRDIILISSIEWDFNWQGHQEIALRFARAGNRVLYVENMGVRSPRIDDAGRVATRFYQWAKALPDGGVREVEKNLYICSPLILPPFGSGTRRRVNRRALLPLVRRTVKSLGFNPEVIWTFLPTDTAASLVRLLRTPRSVVVYYCIADFAELAPRRGDILKSEQAVIGLSDLVFAQCDELAEHCARDGRRVEVFAFGVNLDLFTNGNGHANNGHVAHDASHDEAAALMSGLPRPVIGYVGGIHRFFDAGLLASMARARPAWSWVLVGPLQTPPGELKQIPNVHLVGAKAHAELPAYIGSFDVGIVPYLSNDYTATVVPTKINEYLAMGKPVVSTNLPQVRSFNGEHGVIITSPNRTAEFVASIERALDAPAREASAIARRKRVAAESDWGHLVGRMSLLIEAELRRKSAARQR